jgi:hypothetical protein
MGGKGGAVAGPAFTVSTKLPNADMNVKKLLGNYAEEGANHGRKVYKLAGFAQVYLFYWDARDGADSSGWWFGSKPGTAGTEFFARAVSTGQVPPTIGWRCPWDKPPTANVLVVEPAIAGGAGKAATIGGAAGKSADDILKATTTRMTGLEALTKRTLESAKPAIEGKGGTPAVERATASLKGQLEKVAEAQKSLIEDMTAAKTARPQASKETMASFTAFSAKLKELQKEINIDMQKLVKITRDAEKAAKQAEEDKKRQEQETKDTKALKELMLPVLKEVAEAMTMVDKVVKSADPILADSSETLSDDTKAKMKEIEEAAGKAQEKVSEVKKSLGSKQKDINGYAKDTKAKGLKDLQDNQAKLSEALRKCQSLKRLEQDFEQRVTARKSLVTTVEQLEKADADVSAAMATCEKGKKKGQISVDVAIETQEQLTGGQTALAALQKSLESKLKGANPAMQDEVRRLQEKAKKSTEKVEKIQLALKPHAEEITNKQITGSGEDLVKAAEEAMKKALDAEDPFLKGCEVLPPDEATVAFKALDEGNSAATTAVSKARAFIASKKGEVKSFTNKDKQEVAQKKLTELETRNNAVHTRLESFKKDTMDRKAAQVVEEVSEHVDACEKQLKRLTELAGVLVKDGVEDVATETVKDAIPPAKEAEKEMGTKLQEAKKFLETKQRSTKGAGNFGPLSQRLTATQNKFNELRKSVMTGDKLLKCKEVFEESKGKLVDADKQVKNIESMGSNTGSDAEVGKLQAAIKETMDALSALQKALQAQVAGAPPNMKGPLTKQVAEQKALLAKVDAVKTSTRGQRETWLSKENLKGGQEKVASIEAAIKEQDQAEGPFLKGIDSLPSAEAEAAVKKSEEAAVDTQGKINEARQFITAKTTEAKQFEEVLRKPALEELAKLTEKITGFVKQVATFRKDTEERKRTTQLQLAGEKLAVVEKALVKTAEDLKPLMEKPLSEAKESAAKKTVEKITALKDGMLAEVDSLKKLFVQVQQANKQAKEGDKEAIEKVTSGYKKVQVESVKLTKEANAHVHDFVSKELLKESNVQAADAEKALAGATEAAAPLVVEKGDSFLAMSQFDVLVNAMRELIEKDAKGMLGIFNAVNGGKAIDQKSFVKYMGTLPKLLEREALDYDEAQREEMFKQVSTKNKISNSDFAAFFVQRFTCVQPVTVTDKFEAAEDATVVVKLDALTVVECIGVPKEDEEKKLTRLEIKVPSTGQTGWVSMKSNKGALFLRPVTKYTEWCKTLDGELAKFTESIKELDVKMKEKQLEFNGAAPNTALHETKSDFAAVRKRVSACLTGMDALKKNVVNSKHVFKNRESADVMAQAEITERRAAEAILKVARDKVAIVDAAVEKLESVAKPLASAAVNDMKVVEKPITLREAAEKLAEEVVAGIPAAREAIKEQTEALAKSTHRAMSDARRELTKFTGKLDSAEKRQKGLLNTLKSKFTQIANAWVVDIANAGKEDATKQAIGYEALFDKVAGQGSTHIQESAFCRYVEKLPGMTLPAEHGKVISRHLGAEGVSRLAFLKMFQQYWLCVKPIAITSVFDISETKTVRRVETNEVIELLEGPKGEEPKEGAVEDKAKASQMQRIRGRALLDGAEGWISVKGNQGTPFLRTTLKPCYKAVVDTELECDYDEDSGKAGMLKADDLFELLEGPKEQETVTMRAKVKSMPEGTEGWMTVDKKGGDNKIYKVCSNVVITDSEDIKASKVIKKLEVDDLIILLEGPKLIEEQGLTPSRPRPHRATRKAGSPSRAARARATQRPAPSTWS